jgi:hypothetical protein
MIYGYARAWSLQNYRDSGYPEKAEGKCQKKQAIWRGSERPLKVKGDLIIRTFSEAPLKVKGDLIIRTFSEAPLKVKGDLIIRTFSEAPRPRYFDILAPSTRFTGFRFIAEKEY